MRNKGRLDYQVSFFEGLKHADEVPDILEALFSAVFPIVGLVGGHWLSHQGRVHRRLWLLQLEAVGRQIFEAEICRGELEDGVNEVVGPRSGRRCFVNVILCVNGGEPKLIRQFFFDVPQPFLELIVLRFWIPWPNVRLFRSASFSEMLPKISLPAYLLPPFLDHSFTSAK